MVMLCNDLRSSGSTMNGTDLVLYLFSAEKWNVHRRLIQPSFHNSILEKFIGTFTDASQCLVTRLKEAPKELNITAFVNNCVIDILNGKYRKTKTKTLPKILSRKDRPHTGNQWIIKMCTMAEDFVLLPPMLCIYIHLKPNDWIAYSVNNWFFALFFFSVFVLPCAIQWSSKT